MEGTALWLWLAVSHSAVAVLTLYVRARLRGQQPGAQPATVTEAASSPDRVQALLDAGDVRTAAQPVVDLATGRVVGVEMLSRFGTGEVPPDQMFMAAARAGLLVELEMLSLERALAAAADMPEDLYLSINVSPATLMAPQLSQAILDSGVAPERIVLELTEHLPIDDYEPLRHAVANLRFLGIRTAVDDAGAGYSSFRHILRLAPDYIKIDRAIISDIHNDAGSRALAAAIVMFALEMKSSVIAEGVESPDEMRLVSTLGMEGVQGFLFQRPTEDRAVWQSWAEARYDVADAPLGEV